MSEFVIVDLGSQAEAVARYVRGWSTSRFLTWLGQYGEVIRVQNPSGGERYSFHSKSGEWSGFWITDTRTLNLLRRDGGGYNIVSVPLHPLDE
jgi:hypothetical protein